MHLKAPRETLILGIESSCDETAAAVVRSGRDMLSNAVFSQIATHLAYGGVVPELASREHLRVIAPIVRQAVSDAGLSYDSLDAIAVTQGPGLAGALLVGITFAKALAFALQKPLIAVNHIAGHIHAVLMELEHARQRAEYPLLALVVSGGHTHLYLVEQAEGASGLAYSYRNLGRTLDDAAGEAFDKVAKLLGLPYPGGPVIDALAKYGDPSAVKFALSQIKEKIYREKKGLVDARVDFSFSGIKTAALRHVELHRMQPGIEARRKSAQGSIPISLPIETLKNQCDRQTLDLIASFQSAVVNDLITKTLRAAEITGPPRGIVVSGGVAANSELRRRFVERAAERGLPVYFPSRGLSTDNAAMIAAAAYPKYLQGEFAEAHFNAEPNLALH